MVGILELELESDEVKLSQDWERVRRVRIELEDYGLKVTPNSYSIRGILRGARDIFHRYKSRGWKILGKFLELNRAAVRLARNSAKYCIKRIMRYGSIEDDIREIDGYAQHLERLEEV